MNLIEALTRWEAFFDRSPRTREGYRFSIRALAARGIVTVEDVTLQALAQDVAQRAPFVKAQTINTTLAAVFAALRALTLTGDFPKKSLRKLRSLRVKVKIPRRFTARHLERHDYDALVERARRTEPRIVLPLQVGTLAGLRAGELARLRWEDLDLGDRPYIRVRVLLDLGQAGRVKTGNERQVPICAELRAVLIERRLAGTHPSGFLFPSIRKKGSGRNAKTPFMSTKTLGHEVRRVRGTDFAYVTFPVLRHTRASWWVQAGVPLAKVAHWLGHSPEVCERFYASLRNGYDPDCEAIAPVDLAFPPQPKTA